MRRLEALALGLSVKWKGAKKRVDCYLSFSFSSCFFFFLLLKSNLMEMFSHFASVYSFLYVSFLL